jgi:hypothetical protein
MWVKFFLAFLMLIWINANAKDFYISPSIITAQPSGEANYFILGQKEMLLDKIAIQGLPEGASWHLLCTGSRGDKCSKGYGKDDLPVFTLRIDIPSKINKNTYDLKMVDIDNTSRKISFKLQIIDTINFSHPGILMSNKMLKKIKSTIDNKDLIRHKAFVIAEKSGSGSPLYKPHPHSLVNSDNQSGVDYREDAIAAYTQALLWYVTGNESYADNAIAIMNAWSETLNSDFIGANRFNLAAWTGDVWPRAAEIIRYTYINENGETKWAPSKIAKFSMMLKTYTVDFINNGYFTSGYYGGNLLLSQAAAFINIGVFNNDPTTFIQGLNKWRRMLPAYIYMKSDGYYPVPPSFWRNSFINSKSLLSPDGYWRGQNFNSSAFGKGGLSQETCRDIGHVLWGLSAITNGMETARIQGFDLANEYTLGMLNSTRLKYSSEFNIHFYNDSNSINTDSPTNPCGKKILLGSSIGKGELLLNQINNRDGISLPETESFIQRLRPTGESYFMIWETLTHYNNP